jgi:ankyrin repeat protein
LIENNIGNIHHGFYVACYVGDIDIVRLLINCGAIDWNYGLIHACVFGHRQIIDLMIEKIVGLTNIPIESTFSQFASIWNHVLQCACHSKNIDIAKLMIDLGANNFDKLMQYCCSIRRQDIIQLQYIQHILPVQKEITENDCVEMTKFIFKQNVKFDLTSFDSRLGFVQACENGHINLVKLFIEKGYTDFDSGFEYACYNNRTNIIKLLLEHGTQNWNAVYGCAARTKDKELIELIVDKFNKSMYKILQE